MTTVSFHDYKPKTLKLKDAVMEGFAKSPKSLPPKFFYDERGSDLFDQICAQPEYYPPDVERRLLRENAEAIAEHTGKGRLLIEPGAGALVKARLLLDALEPAAFIPMDISFDYLRERCEELSEERPHLAVHAVCVDFSDSLPVPTLAPDAPRLLFFPGSSIGNFDEQEIVEFLNLVRETIGDGGMALIGVDTKKDEAVLNAAYNDAAGVTAEFNLNLLERIRHELLADVDPAQFEHLSFYNAERGRIEMHLVSRIDQTVHIREHGFAFKAGERLHTENSYKYAPEEFEAIAQGSGLKPVDRWLDDDKLFGLYLLSA